jgi:hypothetical protein
VKENDKKIGFHVRKNDELNENKINYEHEK